MSFLFGGENLQAWRIRAEFSPEKYQAESNPRCNTAIGHHDYLSFRNNAISLKGTAVNGADVKGADVPSNLQYLIAETMALLSSRGTRSDIWRIGLTFLWIFAYAKDT